MFFPSVSIILYKETERLDRFRPTWKAVHMLCAAVFQNTRFRERKKGKKKDEKGRKKVLTKEKGGGILSKLSPGDGRTPKEIQRRTKEVLDSGKPAW